jgi:hypothetical protein
MNTLMKDISFFAQSNFGFFTLSVIGFAAIFAIVRGFIKPTIFVRGLCLSRFIFCILLMAMPAFAGMAMVTQDTNKDSSMNKILGLLPKEVMGKISQDKLVVLQDKSSSSAKKALIVDEIRTAYLDYTVDKNKGLSKEEALKRYVEEYSSLTGMLDDQKLEYIKSANKESPISQLLGLLPKEVIGKISQDKLVVLQNALSSPIEKSFILEEIRTAYLNYIMDSSQGLPQEEINKRYVEEYSRVIGMIDNHMTEYISSQQPRPTGPLKVIPPGPF